LVVDMFAAKISETNAGRTDVDLYGINAAYDLGNYDSEIEAYWILSRNDIGIAATTVTNAGNSIHTIGVRGSVTPVDNLNLLGEIAIQRGDYDTESATTRKQKALAYQVAGEYAFPDVTIPYVNTTIMSPMAKIGYTHYSGEEFGNTGDQEAWMPLYEDQTHGVVANRILTGLNGGQNSNADILNIGGSISPVEDLTVSLDWYKFWLDEKLVKDTAQNLGCNSGVNHPNITDSDYFMNPKDDLGYELDLALNYDYTEDVKMGLTAGFFKCGDAWDGASGVNSNDETAIEVLGTLDVAF